MGCFSWVNTELNWLFRAFALFRSLIIGWSFIRSVGMPMFSRLFALINDQNRFGLYRLFYTGSQSSHQRPRLTVRWLLLVRVSDGDVEAILLI